MSEHLEAHDEVELLPDTVHQGSAVRFHGAFEAAGIGFAVVEIDGRIRAVNRSLCEILGYDRSELLSLQFKDVTHVEDIGVTRPLRELLLSRDQESIQVEKRYIHKEGRVVWAVLSVSLVRDVDGAPQYFVCQITNVTQFKETELLSAHRAADLARSKAELEQFAYFASHDLQQPLRTIASYSQLLAQRYAEFADERTERWTGFVLDGVQRMQRLMDDLVAVARVRTHGAEFTEVETGSFVSRVWERMQALHSSVDATLEIDRLPLIEADAAQLEQIFQNLLENAFKYRAPSRALRVQIFAMRRTDVPSWHFAVRDNGIGFDMKHSERVFDVFQRLHRKEEYEGSGIGLAICRRIVERHGGSIWVESAPDEGSTFHFTLPAQQLTAGPSLAAALRTTQAGALDASVNRSHR